MIKEAIGAVIADFEEGTPEVVTVPEWKGLKIYPARLNLAMQQKIEAAQISGGNIGQAVEILLLMAKDGDGEALFDLDDKPKLMRKGRPGVVARVANEVYRSAAVASPLSD